MNVQLSFWRCLGVQALKSATWLYAWALVPVGMLTGHIKKGPLRKTQWTGMGLKYKGEPVNEEEIESIVCEGWCRIFDLPDEPSIGQYEPTVYRVYKKFGWWIAVWYQMAFRNVGHGWPYLWALPGNDEWVNRLGPFYYGRRPYRNWRGRELWDKPGSSWLDNPLAWYTVPGVWLKVDWR